MGFLFVGSLVFVVWAVLAWATRHERALKHAPLRRIAELDDAEIVKIHGSVAALGPERVAAALSGLPVLFSAFHGIATVLHHRSRRGERLERTVGVPFGVRDGSSVEAVIASPELVRADGTSRLESIRWQHPDEISGLRARLGPALDRWPRLQGRDITLSEGDEVTVVARAEPRATHVVLTPLPGLGIFVTLGGTAELERRIQGGKRFLRVVLALAVSLIGAGIYSLLS